MDVPLLFQKFGLALGLGLLIGIQRERSASTLAGFRTFPLVTMFGTLCAFLSQLYGWGVLGAGLLALVAVVVIGNVANLRAGQVDPGMTTRSCGAGDVLARGLPRRRASVSRDRHRRDSYAASLL